MRNHLSHMHIYSVLKDIHLNFKVMLIKLEYLCVFALGMRFDYGHLSLGYFL